MPKPAQLPTLTAEDMARVAEARVYVKGAKWNLVHHFQEQRDAYAFWLGLRKGVRAAMRSAGDATPVYPWDYADAM